MAITTTEHKRAWGEYMAEFESVRLEVQSQFNAFLACPSAKHYQALTETMQRYQHEQLRGIEFAGAWRRHLLGTVPLDP